MVEEMRTAADELPLAPPACQREAMLRDKYSKRSFGVRS